MSSLSTHILDTSLGRPAAGISIILSEQDSGKEIARGITNADGRIPELLGADKKIQPGTYKIHFAIKDYFDRQHIASFYPFIEIVFIISNEEHYHVPLLLNPFGYSTYRGS